MTAPSIRETKLLRQISDLKAGVAFHIHRPIDGTAEFRCSSPYCEDLTSPFPVGRPPDYAADERYARRDPDA